MFIYVATGLKTLECNRKYKELVEKFFPEPIEW